MIKPRDASLSIVLMNDGLYHFVGSVYELELHKLSCKGWENYQDAIDIRNEYGYKEWKP